MTKDRIETAAKHIRDLIAFVEEHLEPDSDLPAFRAALALLTDEAEADRKLGAAVRKVGNPDLLNVASFHVQSAQDRSIAEHGRSVGALMVQRSCSEALAMLEAIAAALRDEEADHG